MAKIRIIAENPVTGSKQRIKGQDVRILFERDSGDVIELTKELDIIRLQWWVDSRTSYATALLAVHGVEIEGTVDLEDLIVKQHKGDRSVGFLGRKTNDLSDDERKLDALREHVSRAEAVDFPTLRSSVLEVLDDVLKRGMT